MGSPFRANESLGDRVDGIIFFRPVNEFSIPHIEPKMFDDVFLKRIEKRTKGEVKTLNDLYLYIKKNHPILSEDLDSLSTNLKIARQKSTTSKYLGKPDNISRNYAEQFQIHKSLLGCGGLL